jgi:purine-nucleoside phosphorylase
VTTQLYEKAREAANYIEAKAAGRSAKVAVILGSGLGGVADAIEDPIQVPYGEIPHFVKSTVDGHDGKLIIGRCGGIEVAVMKGRFHFYEGYTMEEVTLPTRVFSLMGIRSLIVTNAAGGTAPQLLPGSVMVITDHINLMSDNPLVGPNDPRFGPRFPDMTSAYAPDYIALAHQAAREIGIKLAQGVYAALRGPSYETPSEIRMLIKLGADAVGMSTVPEVIVARHAGVKVLGFSCITNTAAGLANKEIDHSEVMEVGARAGKQLSELIVRIIPRL